jgi:hypothetical protein
MFMIVLAAREAFARPQYHYKDVFWHICATLTFSCFFLTMFGTALVRARLCSAPTRVRATLYPCALILKSWSETPVRLVPSSRRLSWSCHSGARATLFPSWPCCSATASVPSQLALYENCAKNLFRFSAVNGRVVGVIVHFCLTFLQQILFFSGYLSLTFQRGTRASRSTYYPRCDEMGGQV